MNWILQVKYKWLRSSLWQFPKRCAIFKKKGFWVSFLDLKGVVMEILLKLESSFDETVLQSSWLLFDCLVSLDESRRLFS